MYKIPIKTHHFSHKKNEKTGHLRAWAAPTAAPAAAAGVFDPGVAPRAAGPVMFSRD